MNRILTVMKALTRKSAARKRKKRKKLRKRRLKRAKQPKMSLQTTTPNMDE
jgi:hypothetical protein